MITTLTTTRDTHAIEPTSFEEAFRMAEVLFNSKMFPESCRNVEQAMVVLLKGRELGIPTMQAMTEIYVVKGRVQLSANLMMGLVLRSGVAEYFACAESTPQIATYRTKRRGDPTGEKILNFSIEDAQRAGLVRTGKEGKGVWEAHPADMLRARASSKLARMVYPDVLSGCYTADEIADMQESIPVGPLPVSVLAEQPTLPAKPPTFHEMLDGAACVAELDELSANVSASTKLTDGQKAERLHLVAVRRAEMTGAPAPVEPERPRGASLGLKGKP